MNLIISPREDWKEFRKKMLFNACDVVHCAYKCWGDQPCPSDNSCPKQCQTTT